MIRGALLTCSFLALVPLTALAQESAPPRDDALELGQESAQEATPLGPVEEPLVVVLERAERLDAGAEHRAAAEVYEQYAERCLASRTAMIEASLPCADSHAALARAFELRRALFDVERAEADAAAFSEHFLYAQPRAALEIAFALVQMHLDAQAPQRADEVLDRLEAAHHDSTIEVAILTDAHRARVARALGQERRALRYWRRVERGWERARSADGDDAGAGASVPVHEAVAEGRLVRAEVSVARFLDTEGPRTERIGEVSVWWRRVMSPWLVRSRRRLTVARVLLERVYELGSPRHSVVAAARIGQLYGHLVDLHAALQMPDSDVIQALIGGGSMRPGYEEARTHFETCVSWASHHRVAPRWAARCEARLRALDPDRAPDSRELHGQAGYHPMSHALPSDP